MLDRENAPESQNLPAGTRLNDIFEVDRLIASGGMGAVYQGRAIETGDRVAIKTIRPTLAGDEGMLALFRREAAALHQIHHPAVVRYYIFSIDRALGLAYLAMEYVEGEPIGRILRAGPLSFDDTVTLMRRVAGGLKAAHDADIIHRDVSPDNVVVPERNFGKARIIDFGIARSGLSEGTVIGSSVAGKYGYMSPEQLGLFGGRVTTRSDIYSLGLLIAQCLLGRPIDMLGSHVEIMDKRKSVPDLSSIDKRIEPLLRQMLEPDPARRLASMQDVLDWKPPGAASRAKPAAKAASSSSKRTVALAAAAGLLCAAGLGWAYWLLRGAPGDPGVAFLNAYAKPACMALSPTAIGPKTTKVQAFGAVIEPFEAFDGAFKNKLGYEADVDLLQITPQQCPVASFVGALPVRPPPGLDATLDRPRVRSGEAIAGAFRPRQTWSALLHVSAGGLLTTVTDKVSLTPPVGAFSIPVRAEEGAGMPQLLLALDSDVPLALPNTINSPSQAVLDGLLADARRQNANLSAAIVYFKVD